MFKSYKKIIHVINHQDFFYFLTLVASLSTPSLYVLKSNFIFCQACHTNITLLLLATSYIYYSHWRSQSIITGLFEEFGVKMAKKIVKNFKREYQFCPFSLKKIDVPF